MCLTKLLIFPVEIRIFCPKTTKIGPKLTFLVNLGQAMQAYSMPCWWVGWWLWREGCISQDAYLLYPLFCLYIFTIDQHSGYRQEQINITSLHINTVSSGDDVGVGEQSPSAKTILTPSVELGERGCVILFMSSSVRYTRAGWFVTKYAPQIIPEIKKMSI